MKDARFSKAPEELRRPTVVLENVALIPASLLPFKMQWQAIASDLPSGAILIVFPAQVRQQRVARSVASQLKAKGKLVRVLDMAQCSFAPSFVSES